MGQFINEKQFINNNIFLYEGRLESQYTRFQEKNPTFVTYYHINPIESTTDTGLLSVEQIIGSKSPLKFQKIKDFPVYGLDQIQLDLTETDGGLNTEFNSEVVILPNTINPSPNDFMLFSYLDQDFIFMITRVAYDTIKSNNYWKVDYTLKDISHERFEELERQVVENYTCIFRNIGTADKCIVKDDEFEQLNLLKSIFNTFSDDYLRMYYNKKYNSFITQLDNSKMIYDKYLSHFITTTHMFDNPYGYTTLYITNEAPEPLFLIKYHDTIFGDIERGKKPRRQWVCEDFINSSSSSIFAMYNVTDSVYSIIPCIEHDNAQLYLNEVLYDIIETKDYTDEDIPYLYILISKYFNNEIASLTSIDFDKLKDVNITIDNYREYMVLIPITLFIISQITKKFLSNSN
ncbi:MAG: hypothetical protein PHF63_00620 [Herbinix sp.]|nr:hypothetical protein [Herbinix sp.]